jgi:hypothetical protein
MAVQREAIAHATMLQNEIYDTAAGFTHMGLDVTSGLENTSGDALDSQGSSHGFRANTKQLYKKATHKLHRGIKQSSNAAAGQPSMTLDRLSQFETNIRDECDDLDSVRQSIHLNRTDSSSSANVRPPLFHSHEQAEANRVRQKRAADAAPRSIRHDEREPFSYDSSGSSQAFYEIPPPRISNASGHPFGPTSSQPSSFSMAHQPFFQAPMSSFPPSTSGYMSGIQGPSLSHVGSFDNQRSSATMPESLPVNWRDPFNLNASSSSGTHRPLHRNNPYRQSSPPDEPSGYYPSSGPFGSGCRAPGY